jgi:ABC-2 type transport system permease protein
MLGVLLLKDLRRARRNPIPYLIHLAVPLLITALLGLVFRGGGSGEGGGLGRIRLAVADDDGTPLTSLFRGALNQGEAAERFEALVRPRDEALGMVTNNQVAAALVIPAGFTRAYLTGSGPVRWELVKNPAQQFHPAVVEELLAVVTSALNAVARNFRRDLDEWREVLNGGTNITVRGVGERLMRTGERLDALRRRLDPLPVWYAEETRERPAAGGGAGGGGGGGMQVGNMFAYLLPGLMAMFMLFLADVAMRDLHREIRFRTFRRYCTLPPGTFVFVVSKVAFTFVVLAVGAAVLLGGGSVIFGFRWREPVAVAGLALGLALFAGGLMALLASLIRDERRADQVNTLVAMIIGLASGCAFPSPALPTLLRDHVTPWLPPNWFIETVRAAQFADHPGPWPVTASKLAVLGLVLAALAAWRLRRRLAGGLGE